MDILPEFIPNEDKLFYHVSKNSLCGDFDKVPPANFVPQGVDLSVNWEKYCKDAEECLSIKTSTYPGGRTSKTHGVGHFIAGEIREIQFLDVKHTPSASNKAHSSIIGIPPKVIRDSHNETKKKLSRIFKYWDIRPEE